MALIAFYGLLADLNFARIDQFRKGGHLFKTTLEKALFSSPAACEETIEHRLHQLYKAENPDNEKDISVLEELKEGVAAVTFRHFSKYQKLVELLKDPKSQIHWTFTDKTDRLVIFTERIATLNFLYTHLPKNFDLCGR